MSITIEARCADAFGNHLKTFRGFGFTEGAALDYVMNVGKSGALNMTIPRSLLPRGNSLAWLPLDGRIGIWRSVLGRTPALEGQSVYLIRKWTFTKNFVTVSAFHANTLKTRRVVGYDKSTTYSDKAATAADSLIRTIWLENFAGSISAADRDGAETQADISAYVSASSAAGSGASVAIQAGRRPTEDVFNEIEDGSLQAGTYVTSEIVSLPTTNPATLEFRTYVDHRGTDRGSTSADPVILSEESGTLEDIELVIDRTDEVTVVTAVGAGDDDLRLTQTAIATDRIGDSPFNRIESTIDVSNIDDDVQLLLAAEAELQRNRPLILFTGHATNSGRYLRGIHYDLGDIVVGKFEDNRYDCRLDMIRCTIGHNNRSEQILLRNI